ncbi:MAG: GNAT family N-acetyltransferase [Bacteroidetes bacterium]|nr:GNAT family N-acetyltransferase [Bacteroidota bacterium]
MIRSYQPSDLPCCKEIVEKVWHFSDKFRPEPLADLFRSVYTESSLGESTHGWVVEEEGVVRGFLFGKAVGFPQIRGRYSGVGGSFRFLWTLFGLKGVGLPEKWMYLKAVQVHEVSRRKVEPERLNEVNLFAVDPAAQGKGYGRLLMQAYLSLCEQSGVGRVTLDTDRECNVGFYESMGFSVKGVFDSPLQKLYSGTSGESFVYEKRLKTNSAQTI